MTTHKHTHKQHKQLTAATPHATGQYRFGTCGPTLATDYTCRECTPTCRDGQFIARSCAAGTLLSDTVCGTCKTCAIGTYSPARCDGTGVSDVVQCRECKTTCARGFRMDGACDGTTLGDVIECVQVCVKSFRVCVCVCVCLCMDR